MISAIDKIAAGRKKYYAFYLEIFLEYHIFM